jgi:hypothetical protein
MTAALDRRDPATAGLNDISFQSYTMSPLSILRGIMANLENALQQLRSERRESQLHVEKLDQAISVIESLNGGGSSHQLSQPKRIISAASRRKMAQAQRARWANARKESHPVAATGSTHKTGHTMSASARRKIAVAQRARWAKLKAGKKVA